MTNLHLAGKPTQPSARRIAVVTAGLSEPSSTAFRSLMDVYVVLSRIRNRLRLASSKAETLISV